MTQLKLTSWQHLLFAPWLALLVACGTTGGAQVQTGSQTNWLKSCSGSAECGELDCLCGTCASTCTNDAACSELAGASCVAASDPGVVAVCDGYAPKTGMCLPLCGTEPCAGDTSCVAGVCVPAREPDVRITVDPTARYQTLVGFGASLAYAEDAMVDHPEKGALFDALFADSGFTVVRLRDRYDGKQAELGSASEILAAASSRIGRTPTIFMTSGTPPAALKANGARTCTSSDADTCTLITTASGAFNYSGFADHWRASLEAHAAVSIVPDYLSIQNNPNWIPDGSSKLDACRFLAKEGTATVSVDGEQKNVAFPGYLEALTAVRAALSALDQPPRFAAPEVTSLTAIADYSTLMNTDTVDALAHHLYESDPNAIDLEPFHRLRDLGKQSGLPIFQTEMRADGLGTAILAQYALTEADAQLYLQNDCVVPSGSTDVNALVALTQDGFETQGPYHALRHYARSTQPGWVRIDATPDSSGVLSSAWLSPTEEALTVVVVNPLRDSLSVKLNLPKGLPASPLRTRVSRTVFEGIERSADLGPLPSNHVLTLPGASIVTVSFVTGALVSD